MNPNTLAAQPIGHRKDHDFESRLGHGLTSSFSLCFFSLCRQALRRADPPSEDFYLISVIIIISVMELGQLLTLSDLMYPEVSSKVHHVSFCPVESSVSLPWVIYFEAFYLHVVSSFSCIPVVCPKLVLFLTPLQFVHLFCNVSKCILLFFSYISSLLLLFFWRPWP